MLLSMISAIQTIFQSKCFHCKIELADDKLGLCNGCSSEISFMVRRLPSSDYIHSMWALSPYHGPMGSLIRQGKYMSKRRLFTVLGRLMAEAALDLPAFDAIVHVPVPWHRKIHRGFDQAEVLAQAIQTFLSVPHYKVLRRKGFERQAQKTMEARAQNFLSQFYCLEQKLPSRILLVDDTITTGATLEACGAALYQQGVEEIIGFALSSTKF